jgi:anthranilate synthase component I
MQEGYILKELKGDTFTPISILQKISGQKKFLLESSHKYNDSGRYSFIGSDPSFEFISHGSVNQLLKRNGEIEVIEGNPLEILKKLMPSRQINNLPFPFTSGAIGYVGYDIIRQFEDIGVVYKDELEMPDVHLMFYEVIIVFDHLEEKVMIFGTPLLENSLENEIEEMFEKREEELKQPSVYQEEGSFRISNFTADMEKDAFLKNIEIAKEHINSGDIFQVVLSQRMQTNYQGEPLDLYRKHRANNPTPYMFYIDFQSYTVIGSSPESLIKTNGHSVTVNPIAGTKKRGKNMEEDKKIEQELLNDEKELAEHKMLVDLGRNDLGRVCDFGSLQIEKYLSVEKFRHVIHLVSEISGILREDRVALDALAACLPAGTVSGAPKIRAMEIINNLERSKRGLYSGAIGYLSSNGNIDFALAIRTMILKEGKAYIQAGAGIVYDSNPKSEYEETLNKLRSFLEGVK